MFRLHRMGVDTLSEHVVFLHERAVREGALGVHPLDRVRVLGRSGERHGEVTAVLNFCRTDLLEKDEVGLSEAAFADLGLPEGAPIEVTLARSPESLECVRDKLRAGGSAAPTSTPCSGTSARGATRSPSSRCSCSRARCGASTRRSSSRSPAR